MATMDRAMSCSVFSLLELNFKHAVTAILNKPQWWTKWQDPATRAQWLRETRGTFIRKTFNDCLLCEADAGDAPTFVNLEQLVHAPYSDLKEAQASEWCHFVRYERNYYVGKYERELAGVPGERGSMIEFSKSTTKTRLTWYLALANLHQKLTALPVEHWTIDTLKPLIQTARERSDPEVRIQFLNFMNSILFDQDFEVSDERVRVALGTYSESRPKVIALLLARCKEVRSELTQLQQFFEEEIENCGTRRVSLLFSGSEAASLFPAGIFCSWISDDAVSSEVKSQFTDQVTLLENVPEEIKDWNPKTVRQVLNLVHPLMFYCIPGKTKCTDEPLHPKSFASPREQMEKIMFAVNGVVENPEPRRRWMPSDKFQWPPSDFQVREDGSVRILSYINNLHPVHHAPMYTSIETIFSRFVPMFERLMLGIEQARLRPVFKAPTTGVMSEHRPVFCSAKNAGTSDDISEYWDGSGNESPLCTPRYWKLRGKTVQVIVKLTEVLLTPASPEYRGGPWQIDGTDEENIAAAGVYYFGCENIRDSRLSFRVEGSTLLRNEGDRRGVAAMYGLKDEDLFVQKLGSVSAAEGRCLVYPDGLQHKVEPFKLEDPTRPGALKVLTFFLVEPSEPIPSTSVIPPQQQAWVDECHEPVLKKTHTLLDVAETKVRECLSFPERKTLQQAREDRLRLMDALAHTREFTIETSPLAFFHLCCDGDCENEDHH